MTYELKKIALGLFMCIALICFNACGDDSDPDPAPTPEKVTATVTYKYTCQADVLLLADIAITYTGADGKEVTEAVKESPWEKKITKVEVPFVANLKIVYTRKTDVTLDKETYKLGDGHGINYQTTNGSSSLGSTEATASGFPKDKVDVWFRDKSDSKEIK